jgi:hypothetical protein
MPGAPPYRAIAERRVCDHLLTLNAVSPGGAQPLEGLRWIQQRALQRLMAAGVILEDSPGRFYLYAPAYSAHMASRRRRVKIALIVVIVALMLTATGALTAVLMIVPR